MTTFLIRCLIICLVLGAASPALAQEEANPETSEENTEEAQLTVTAGEDRDIFIGRPITFDLTDPPLPNTVEVNEILWDLGDGVRITGDKISHTYEQPGTYQVTVTVATEAAEAQDTVTVRVFEHVALLVSDASAPEEQIALRQQQAAESDLLLLSVRAKGGGPEVLIEEDLTNQMLNTRDAIAQADVIMVWTSGSVGANVLSKFAQQVRSTEELSVRDLNMEDKGIVMISETPFAVLAPTAQAAFDQLQPLYVLLSRPGALELLMKPLAPTEARDTIFASPIDYRLLGAFSARTVRDVNAFNFMSFGINYLVNHGVPINSITLILMLPVIATILSFSRQVIGIKAFGIITPAMAALSFLVIGLKFGLIVFAAMLLSGTLTRLVVRKLHLLYLPRMALVLTSVSLAVLLLLGLGVSLDTTSALSFSIFPVLILTLLAEEFISVQFSSGARTAFTITMWTILLAILCYFIVSWELFRTLIISYPEIVLLAIPINLVIGRWSGLRLVEYFRFRKLLQYSSSSS